LFIARLSEWPIQSRKSAYEYRTQPRQKLTSHADSRRAILQGMLKARITWNGDRSGLLTSGLAYPAFPGYVFRSTQGAALAVGRVVRQMCKDGHLQRDFGKGYHLTIAGAAAAAEVSIEEQMV
jgi:hypothetical protein